MLTQVLLAVAIVAIAVYFTGRRQQAALGKSGVAQVTAAELAEIVKGRGKAVIIDVREPDEFRGPLKHIQGSRNIPLAALKARTGEVGSAKGAPVYLICRSSARAMSAATILSQAGYTDLKVLKGGMLAWQSAGLPVEG